MSIDPPEPQVRVLEAKPEMTTPVKIVNWESTPGGGSEGSRVWQGSVKQRCGLQLQLDPVEPQR